MEIKRWQAKTLCAGLRPGLRYLHRLKERAAKAFRPDDPLVQLSEKAFDAVHRLWVALHYRSCTGVGGPSGEE